jgi:hypothetical protein
VYRAAGEATRWFGAAAFVFLVEYYLFWLTWYQKVETLASAAVLAATLWLLAIRLPLPRAAGVAVASAGMLALAAMQGFIRADVAVAAHLGTVLVCFTRRETGFALPRAVQAATSLVAILLAGGIQYYLMHVAYPSASYGSTPVFELALNIRSVLGLVPFALFMLPYGWTVATVLGGRRPLDGPDAALLAASGIYLGLWWVLGRVAEVRIFLPYALVLVPLTVECAMERFPQARTAGEV